MPTALITGASGGLGKEFALLFAAGGYDVVLVARSKDALVALKKEIEKTHKKRSALVIAADLSLPGAPQAVFAATQKARLTVDVLVNNAGFGGFGLFHKTEWEGEAQMIDVNVRALTGLTKMFLPGMVKRRRGRILNVASVAAFVPGPLMAVYYATKAYVLSFSEAIRNELRGTGVTVTCLCPGPTKTQFAQNAQLGKSRLFRRRIADARMVAAIGYRACLAGKGTVVPGFLNAVQVFAARFASRQLAASIARRAQEQA
jgi:short-subunit dehydrogenase